MPVAPEPKRKGPPPKARPTREEDEDYDDESEPEGDNYEDGEEAVPVSTLEAIEAKEAAGIISAQEAARRRRALKS
jgi:hypothetical protein